MVDRGNTKGSVFLSRLAFLRERGGDPLVARVLATLPPDDRETLSGIVLPSTWYPFDMNERLDAAIASALGGGDDIFRLLGRQSALHNLSASHRNFIRAHDPHGLFRQTASIYRVYYDSGSRTYEKLGPKKVALRTVESKSFSRADCLTIVGWLEQAVEMCGGVDVRATEPRCRARGDSLCEYVVEWR